MNIQNFTLNNIFLKDSKEYQSKPVRAAKYRAGMENGFMVYFTNKSTKEKRMMVHEGVRFFPTETKAWDFINASRTQYIIENGEAIEIVVEYDPPKPVLYRKDTNLEDKSGMLFCFGDSAFVSDESCDYEFYILEYDCWIIQEMDGGIRVWYPDLEDETFFGKETNLVYERVGGEEKYIPVVI